MSSSLIIPDDINDLSRWDQVFFFHRHGDTVLPLHPPGKNKKGKTALSSKPVKRLSDFDLRRHFGNGASYNVGIIPRGGDIVVNLDGDTGRGSVDSFLSSNPALAVIPTVQTAAGFHLRFHCDDLPDHVRQSGHFVQTGVAPGVNFELITGNHYVVAPPSLHEQGFPYKWVVMGEVPTWSWEQIATVFNLPPQQVPVENDARENNQRDNIGGVGGLLELPMPDGKEILNLSFTGNSPEIARQVFKRLAEEDRYFVQGRKLVRYDSTSKTERLSEISPDQLRSLLDKFFHPFKPAKRGGEPHPATADKNDTLLLLASDEMKSELQYIARVVQHPLLVVENGKPEILTTGAHDGIFIDSSDTIPNVPISEAVPALLDLFRDFKFNTPNDRSRAIAHLLSPALVFGNLLSDRVPMHVVQADQPGSGRGFMQKQILSIYNEASGIITNISKGVGGIDEALSRRLLDGLPFIQYDNWRGKLASEMLESALTEDTASCRALHSDGIVPTKGAFFMLTSNGAELTPDLADRCCFVRIMKRPDGYQWSKYADGEYLSRHVENLRVYYLGCIYSVLSEWIRQGKPQNEGAPHRFWEWAGSMDWIVRNIFGLSPLLDGHRQVQKEVASSILVFLRQAGIKVQLEGRLGEELTAFALIQLAQRHDLTIPGVKDNTDEKAHQALGLKLSPCFKDKDSIELDGSLTVVRKVKKVKREDGTGYFDTKVYVFFGPAVGPDASSGPFNCGGPKSGPTTPGADKKEPTTAHTAVGPAVEPQLEVIPSSTAVSQPPQHQAVADEKTTGPQLAQLDSSVFAQYNNPGGDEVVNTTGVEKSGPINCVNCGGDGQSSWLVSQPNSNTAFALIRKKSEITHIADTLSGVTEPLAIDLKTYNKRYPGGPNLMHDDEIRLLSIKAPGLAPCLIDLKEIGYDLGANLGFVLQNREIISHEAASVVKVLGRKCGLDINSVWCTDTAERLLREEHARARSSKIPAWEQYLLLNPPPKDPGTYTDKHGDQHRGTYWRDEITEEQYEYAAVSVEYLHPLKTVLEEALANSPMLHVFHYLNAKIPIRRGTSFVRSPFKEETP
jgi:Bifunctional DNA primase/polymerase, N-terminal